MNRDTDAASQERERCEWGSATMHRKQKVTSAGVKWLCVYNEVKK